MYDEMRRLQFGVLDTVFVSCSVPPNVGSGFSAITKLYVNY
jgi:hypothetical protein